MGIEIDALQIEKTTSRVNPVASDSATCFSSKFVARKKEKLMGLFGKNVTGKGASKISGGGKRVTTSYDDGSSEDKTYDSHGKLVDITHHEKNGSSHSHKVGRGIFGPFTGSRKK